MFHHLYVDLLIFCILMDTSFWFGTISFGYKSIVIIYGCQVIFFKKQFVFFCLKIYFAYMQSGQSLVLVA